MSAYTPHIHTSISIQSKTPQSTNSNSTRINADYIQAHASKWQKKLILKVIINILVGVITN